MPFKPLEITEALDILLLVVEYKLEASKKDMTDSKNWQCNWKGEESWGDMENNILFVKAIELEKEVML